MINTDAPEHWWPAGRVLAAQEALAMPILAASERQSGGCKQLPGIGGVGFLPRQGVGFWPRQLRSDFRLPASPSALLLDGRQYGHREDLLSPGPLEHAQRPTSALGHLH